MYTSAGKRHLYNRHCLFYLDLPEATCRGMNTIDPSQVIESVTDAVRDSLHHGGEAHLPGLGRLIVVHTPASVVEHDNGSVTVMPPSNRIVFQQQPEPK